MPVHVDAFADTQQLVIHFLRMKNRRHRLRCQRHFIKKLSPKTRLEIKQFHSVDFAQK